MAKTDTKKNKDEVGIGKYFWASNMISYFIYIQFKSNKTTKDTFYDLYPDDSWQQWGWK